MTRSSTCSLLLKIPLCQSIASTRVVFPWSTWAIIARFLRSSLVFNALFLVQSSMLFNSLVQCREYRAGSAGTLCLPPGRLYDGVALYMKPRREGSAINSGETEIGNSEYSGVCPPRGLVFAASQPRLRSGLPPSDPALLLLLFSHRLFVPRGASSARHAPRSGDELNRIARNTRTRSRSRLLRPLANVLNCSLMHLFSDILIRGEILIFEMPSGDMVRLETAGARCNHF